MALPCGFFAPTKRKEARMTRARASTLWRTQNFLRDPRLAERLVVLSGIGRGDVVYDLGAGSGVLTAALARHAAFVVAVERDPSLAASLRRRFAQSSNVVVHEADLRTILLPGADYVVFANPPFDITSVLIRKLTSAPVPPREMFLMLQREAAERYIGSPRQTMIALEIAPWFAIDALHRFKKADFVPSPSVNVVLLRVRKRGPPLVGAREAQLYRDLVVTVFAARRPSVGRVLSAAIGSRAAARLLQAADADPASKPSMISMASWIALYRQFASLPESVRARVAGAEIQLRRQQQQGVRKLHRTRAPRDGLGQSSSDHPGEIGCRLAATSHDMSRGLSTSLANLEPTPGLEPGTCGLRNRCSTN